MSELKTKKLFVNEANEKDVDQGWSIEINVDANLAVWLDWKQIRQALSDVVGIPGTAFGDLMIVEVNENCEHISDIIWE